MLRRLLASIGCLVFIALLTIIAFFALGAYSPAISRKAVEIAVSLLQPPAASTEPVTFTVVPGDTGAAIAGRLQQQGLINNPTLFRLLLSVEGIGGSLKAGRYSLRPGADIRAIIATLVDGKENLNTVTIPEGMRLEEVADRVAQAGIAPRAEFLTLAYAGRLQDALPARRPSPSLEGYLFPDTYFVPPGFTAQQLIDMMVSTFRERFTPEMQSAAARAGLSVHEVVTLASLVEREAVRREEQPVVASVFLNRYRQEMMLAADPSVQYALVPPTAQPAGGYWRQELSEDDLRVSSPYNTYLVLGLPPGPIASPGLGALQAVLNPANTTYYYFMAKPDGSHAFASSFSEHQANVARYRP